MECRHKLFQRQMVLERYVCFKLVQLLPFLFLVDYLQDHSQTTKVSVRRRGYLTPTNLLTHKELCHTFQWLVVTFVKS